MSKSIYKLVDSLPENNLTVKMLKALDFVVPGQWKNLVGFEHTIKVLSGESDQAMIQKIGERAIALYNDKKQGYQRAAWFLPALPVSNDGSESLQLWFGWLGFRFRSLNFDVFELRCLQFGSIDFCENRVVGKDG